MKTTALTLTTLLLMNIHIFSQQSDTLRLAYQKEYTSLDEALKNPEQVYSLNLQDKHVGTLPPEISRLTHLRYLKLRNNDLKELPIEIGELKELEMLFAGQNKLATLPQEIWKLRKQRM